MVFQVNLRWGPWSLEFTGEPRIILWRFHGSSGYARWQWDFRSRPVRMRREEMPVITCEAQIVPVRLVVVEDYPADEWADVIE